MWAQALIPNHTHLLCLQLINSVRGGGLKQVCDNRGYYIIIDTWYMITHYMHINNQYCIIKT